MNNIEAIGENVNALRERKNIQFLQHIGGGWHISITSGFWCVDLRKFYEDFEQQAAKPSKQGIALRLCEWDALKAAVGKLHNDVPEIALVLPCFLGLDHLNQEGALQCRECNPYSNVPGYMHA